MNEATNELLIEGAAGNSNDVVTITSSGSQTTVSVDIGNDVAGAGRFAGAGNLPAFVRTFSNTDFDTIRIDTFSGDDVINVFGTGGAAVDVDAGSGSDVINFANDDLDQVAGTSTISGGSGIDVVNFRDQGDGGADNYLLESSRLSKTSGGGVFTSVNFSSFETVTLLANEQANSIDVQDTGGSTEYRIFSNGGDDIVRLGSGDTDTNLTGRVEVNTGDGVDRIVFNDISDTGDDFYNFDSVGGSFYPYEYVKSFGGVVAFGNTTEIVELQANEGNNDINFDAPGAFAAGLTFQVFGNGGDDEVLVGDGTTGIANNDATINFTGGAGIDALVYNAQNVGAIATRFFDGTTLTGGTGGSFAALATTEAFDLNTGSGPDVIDINAVVASLILNVNSGLGNDTVTLGGGDFDTNISGTVRIDLGSGSSDSIIIDDLVDTFDDPYNLTSPTPSIFVPAGFVTFTKGFGGSAVLTSATIDTLRIRGNNGNNAFNLLGGGGLPASLDLVIDGNDGDDTLNIGDGSFGIALWDQSTTFNGGAGSNTVNFNGQNLPGTTYNVQSGSLTNTLSGDVLYSNVSLFNLNTGNGVDTLLVDSLGTTTTFNANLNGGGDEVVLGDATDNVENIDGPVNIFAGPGNDTLDYRDAANTFDDDYSFTNTGGNGLITRSFAGNVTFDASLETAQLFAGSGANVINVSVPTPIDLVVDAGPGTDEIVIDDTADRVRVDAGPGNDIVTLGTSGAFTAAAFINDQTLSQLNLFQQAINLQLGGFLDVTSLNFDGGVIDVLDYAGAFQNVSGNSPLFAGTGNSPVRIDRLISAGYNGGTWTPGPNGGIISSLADATNFAVGHAPGSVAAPGGTFLGKPVTILDTLVRFTRYGDANLDGTVSILDFARLRGGFGSGSAWWQGDFNYDDSVSILDFAVLRGNFGLSV